MVNIEIEKKVHYSRTNAIAEMELTLTFLPAYVLLVHTEATATTRHKETFLERSRN